MAKVFVSPKEFYEKLATMAGLAPEKGGEALFAVVVLRFGRMRPTHHVVDTTGVDVTPPGSILNEVA